MRVLPEPGTALRGWHGRALRAAPLWALLSTLLLTAGECRRSVDEEPPRPQQIFLSATGLATLVAPDGFYELWLGNPAQPPPAGSAAWEVAQTYVSAGRFLVDTLGVVTTLAGAAIASLPLPAGWDPAGLARAVVTYQPPEHATLAHRPGFKLAAGAFQAPGFIVTTQLTATDPEVTPQNLAAITGEVTFATPTTAAADDELLGAWFFRGSLVTPEASLELGGALPDSQVFQAWLLERTVSGRVLRRYSMGRFRSPTGIDSDAAGPAAGPLGPLPFPGQDFNAQLSTGIPFLINPEVMVTLEPEPDAAPGRPTGLRVLRLDVPANAPNHVALALTNPVEAGTSARITVTVQR